MKIAFLGTSEFAVPALRALVDAGHDVAAGYTRAPKAAGRGQQERKTPVHQLAEELGLPVRTPKSLKSEEEAAAFTALDLDAAVVVSYGHILPKRFLDAPVLGCINIHGSLLPRWRGAAPIHRAILAGDSETGVCLMGLEEGLDTGPVYECERVAIGPDDTADDLRDRLVEAGTAILRRRLRDGLGEPVAQEGEATYAKKIEPDELHLDWSLPAEQLHRVVRLGRAWTTLDGKRLLVLRASPVDEGPGPPGTLDGVVVSAGDGRGLRLEDVQPEGKGRQPAKAWRNGLRAGGPLMLGR